MEIGYLNHIEQATAFGRPELFRIGISVLFIVGILIFTGSTVGGVPGGHLLVAAAIIGGYMALNIGANDVANNMGPAVGSKALTLLSAILIAAVFEAAGALVAGGDVVGTIKSGIIDPAAVGDRDTFTWLMTAALLGGALWLNVATAVGAPVSTTHSIVGGVLGAGIAAGGLGIADWQQMGTIAASWVVSPALGGIVAAGFLYFCKRTITYQADMMLAARRMVPLLVAMMAWAFTAYLILKGLTQLWQIEFGSASGIGLAVAAVVYAIVRPLIARSAVQLPNERASVNRLFTLPLIFSAALLSFAHGANDVANAVGPLAAINDAILNGHVGTQAAIPLWVLTVGALGIALGLALYGPRLIRTVGSEITELDQMRAFCIVMAAALTVIVASQLGLPVSSTHIAVGAVFGVGFLREVLRASYAQVIQEIERHHAGEDRAVVERFLGEFQLASTPEKRRMLRQLKAHSAVAELTKAERKRLRKVYKHDLVKRSVLIRIAAAWVITVPVSALLAALLYYTIRGMLMP